MTSVPSAGGCIAFFNFRELCGRPVAAADYIALVTRYFPGRLRGRGQALYSVLGYGFSGVLAGVGGAWLISYQGYPSAFWVASVAALLGAWCAWRSQQLDRG